MPQLFLIPTTLSNTIDHSVLLPHDLARIQHLQHFIVETPKVARMHLRQLQLTTPLQQLQLYELNKHQQDLDSIMQPLVNGLDMGLISDCGMPAIADPGSTIVRLAHTRGIRVVPLTGPSSLLLALMASGVSGQAFAFNGYLPINPDERLQKLRQLEVHILENGQSQIFIEAPFRNQQLFQFLIDKAKPQIMLTIAMNLTTANESILSYSIEQWRAQPTLPNLHKQEVVFILGV